MLFLLFSAMFQPIAVAVVVGLIGWVYKNLKPPPPKICGKPGGPPVTSPRVKLSDGRHLAYREAGVPREKAKYKIIVVHGFGSSKDKLLPVSQELIEDLGVYFLHYDRAGYGESDPYPSRSIKSEAYDIQELADKLQIGPRFYVIGISMGACTVYGCLKYIPHRLSGACLVVPFVNFWWPSFPANIMTESLAILPRSDQWTFRVAHYAPWLFHWWMTQKWFPSLSLASRDPIVFSRDDLRILKRLSETPSPGQEKITQQGVFESLHRDGIVGFGNWGFDPTEISNPFPDNEGSVHIWQGYEDRMIPYQINRYISQKLPWIRYHEVPDGGHLFISENRMCEVVIRALLL